MELNAEYRPLNSKSFWEEKLQDIGWILTSPVEKEKVMESLEARDKQQKEVSLWPDRKPCPPELAEAAVQY